MRKTPILDAVIAAWSSEKAAGRTILDLSAGAGHSSERLAKLGFRVVTTEYGLPMPMSAGIARVGGVNLNYPLPFRSGSFDAVNIVEVIEHIENQPQLIREIGRVLKPGGTFLVSTPNVLNLMSRMRFLFTGFLHGRIRPVHYSKKPGQAPNIYLLHFYELYYLLFHSGFTVSELRRTRVKIPSRVFLFLFWPLLRICSLFAIVYAEKDPLQRLDNRRIMSFMFHPAILLSNNIVVKATKITNSENRPGS